MTTRERWGQRLLHRHFPVVCVAAAVFVRLLWVLLVPAQPSTDFVWYFERGLGIAAGQGYSLTTAGMPLWEPGPTLPSPQPTAFWPVGYPAFLGVLFYLTSWAVKPLLAAKLANVVLYAGAMLAMAYCARVSFRSVVAERVTLLLLAALPNHIAYTSLLSVEIWFLFLTALGGALLLSVVERWSWWRGLACAVVFAIAVHTKPQALLLPGVMWFAAQYREPRRAFSKLLLLYAVLGLCLLPWTLRNYALFHKFILISNNGGINLLIGNMPGDWSSGYMWNPELQRIIESTSNEVEWDSQARRVAVDYILSHPLEILSSLPRKLVTLYMADVDGFGWNRAATPGLTNSPVWLPLRVVSQVYYVALLVGAALGITKLWRASAAYRFVGLSVFLYFSAIYVVFFGGARFHFPVVPWLATYAAAFVAFALRLPEQSTLASPLTPEAEPLRDSGFG